ncbi:MAG TPA: YncE family protein [Actinomycetes bacterium]|nr:YncE family protein [Actinomycetes bacterium]
MDPLLSPRRPLVVVALLLAILVTACDAGRSPSRPAAAAAPTSTADRAAAAARAEQRLALKVHRLRVVAHPQGATLRIRRAGGAVRSGRTPFTGRLPGGHLVLTLTRPGRNTLTQPVLLDRDRSLELWMDPKGLLHHEVGVFTTGPNPKQVAFSPDGRQIWVSLLGGRGVQVFDARTRKLLDQVRLGEHGAVEVIFTADGRTVFASQMETASVFEIDRRTRKVRRQLLTKGNWSKVMALSPDERTLYVANWVSDDVSEIDLVSGKVRRLLPTVRTPRGLYLTPDGGRLFVAGYGDGEIQRIDLRTGASKVLLRTGGAMRHLVGDPQRGRLYADDMALGRAFVVDLASERVRRLATTDKMPNTIDLTPDGRVLYVSNRGKNGACYCAPGPEWGSVLAIDTASGRILDAMVGGNQTTGLDVSPDGRTLAFSDFLDNRVHLYTIPPYRTLARGGGGRALAHLEDLPK